MKISAAESVRVSEALLKSQQVADLLGVSIYYIHDHTRGGKEPVLPAFKIGKNSVRYRRSDVEAWIAKLAEPSKA